MAISVSTWLVAQSPFDRKKLQSYSIRPARQWPLCIPTLSFTETSSLRIYSCTRYLHLYSGHRQAFWFRMECQSRRRTKDYLLWNPHLPVSRDTGGVVVRWECGHMDDRSNPLWDAVPRQPLPNHLSGRARQHPQFQHSIRWLACQRFSKRGDQGVSEQEGSRTTKYSRTNAVLVCAEGPSCRWVQAVSLFIHYLSYIIFNQHISNHQGSINNASP